MRFPWVGLVLVLLAPVASATHAADHVEAPDADGVGMDAQDATKETLKKVGDALGTAGAKTGEAVSGVAGTTGKALGALGSGLGKFFVAVGEGLVKGLSAMGHGLGVAGVAIGHGVVMAAKALAHGFAAAASATADGVVGLGSAIASGFAAAFAAMGAAFALIGREIATARPEQMHPALYYGAVSAGSAAAVGGSGWGLWALAKKYGASLLVGMPLFSRIEKGELLDHPVRNQIYETIKTNPGIHISEIARQTGAGWGTTIHHLRKLRASDMVCIRDVNHQKCYFVNGGTFSPAEMVALSELKNEKAMRLALHVRDHPGVAVTELAAAVGISPSLVSFHANKLVKAGLLEKRREGKAVRLVVPEAARARIMANEQLLASVPTTGVPAAAVVSSAETLDPTSMTAS